MTTKRPKRRSRSPKSHISKSPGFVVRGPSHKIAEDYEKIAADFVDEPSQYHTYMQFAEHWRKNLNI